MHVIPTIVRFLDKSHEGASARMRDGIRAGGLDFKDLVLNVGITRRERERESVVRWALIS